MRRCLFYLSLSGEITALEIGAVYLNTNGDAPETHNNILCRADFNFGNAMSLVIQPGGLSESRRRVSVSQIPLLFKEYPDSVVYSV